MEVLDLYDKNRLPLNRTYDHSQSLEPGAFILVVGIWVVNSKNEILLTKRHPDKKFAPNLWENTGGHVRSGESSIHAVLRELKEETGIQADEEDVSFIGSVKIPPYFGDNYFVRKDVDLSDIVLQEGETCDAKFVSYRQFQDMMESGELAPSVVTHLVPIQKEFEASLMR